MDANSQGLVSSLAAALSVSPAVGLQVLSAPGERDTRREWSRSLTRATHRRYGLRCTEQSGDSQPVSHLRKSDARSGYSRFCAKATLVDGNRWCVRVSACVEAHAVRRCCACTRQVGACAFMGCGGRMGPTSLSASERLARRARRSSRLWRSVAHEAHEPHIGAR